MTTELRKWDFLLGEGESIPESQIGDPEGVTNHTHNQHKPSNHYIFMNNSSIKDGK